MSFERGLKLNSKREFNDFMKLSLLLLCAKQVILENEFVCSLVKGI